MMGRFGFLISGFLTATMSGVSALSLLSYVSFLSICKYLSSLLLHLCLSSFFYLCYWMKDLAMVFYLVFVVWRFIDVLFAGCYMWYGGSSVFVVPSSVYEVIRFRFLMDGGKSVIVITIIIIDVIVTILVHGGRRKVFFFPY